MRTQLPIIFLLTALLALPILSTDIYLPSLYEIEKFFHADSRQVQFTLTGYFFTFGIIQLIYGSLSDCLGRKPICLLSLLIYTISTLLCVFSNNIHMMILMRCLQALGAGSAILTFAIVRDLYEGSEVSKMIAYMSAVVALSPIIAPIIGGQIQSYLSWQWDFILLAFLGLVLFLWCYCLLPETNKNLKSTSSFFKELCSNYRRLLMDRNYISNALAAAFAFGALFAYVSGAPYIFLHLMGYPPSLFGWIFAIGAMGYVLGAFTNGKLVSCLGMDLMHRIGMISFVGGAIMMTLTCYLYPYNVMAIIIPQIFCEFGISIVISISVAKALQPIPHDAGIGSALIGFLRFSSATLASYLVIKFQSIIFIPFALIILGFSLISLFSWGIAYAKLPNNLIVNLKT
jgi:MFS transporter, DHA1 family, multidrug resistance protein